MKCWTPCYLLMFLTSVFYLTAFVLFIILSCISSFSPVKLIPLLLIIIGTSLCLFSINCCRKPEIFNRNAYLVSTISNSIFDQINSQLNCNQTNQFNEPPPSYDMVTIGLPSYDDAVKQKNSNGISVENSQKF